MAIKPVCNRCGKELTEFGAILFSPPDASERTKKWHLCKACYEDIVRNFKE